MRYVLAMFPVLMAAAAMAQPQQLVPLTEWRAQLDAQLGKIAMSREAHGQVIAILQEAEYAAMREKMAKREPPAPPLPAPPPPKEGQ